MNPASFGAPPADACAAGAAGAFGPDRITRTTYDALGRVASVTSGWGLPDAVVESLTYTASGQVETLTDGEGNLTTYVHDGLGRLAAIRYPDPSGSGSSWTDYEEVGYNANDQPMWRRGRDGQFTWLWRDHLGRVTQVTPPSPMDQVNSAYDNLGRLTWMQSGAQQLAYGWDALGRTSWEYADPFGYVDYDHDPAGRLTRITWPDGWWASYVYDLTGALTQVWEQAAPPAGQLAGYAYDDLGRMTGVWRGNGVTTAYGWDGGSRLIGLSHDLPGTAQDQSYAFTWNPAGQAVTRTATNDLYAYTADPNLADAYGISLNQVTAVDGTATAYDARGNLTSDGANVFAYDAWNRLTSGSGQTLSYDPSGRLHGHAGRRFLYAGAQAIAEYDTGGQLLSRYVPGAGMDAYAAEIAVKGGVQRRWPLADRLGS